MKYAAIQGDTIRAEAYTLEELAEKLAIEGWTSNEVRCMITIFEVHELKVEVIDPLASFEIREIG